MPIANRPWFTEIQSTVVSGVNHGRDPELISGQQVHNAQNLSLRGGRMRPRPRFVKRMQIPVGKLQGLTVFSAISKIIVSVAGRVYSVDPYGWSIIEKTSDDDRNSTNPPRHYYCETVGSLVIQDFQSQPLIYDGATFRRSGDGETPVGGPMAYGNGRLAVTVNQGYDVRLGDIRKSEHQSELKFTETYGLDGGGDFNFPSKVKAIAVLPVIDTGSGQGSHIVGCKEGVYSLKTQLTQRALWAEVGFQTVLLPNRGIVGDDAVTAVNQDLYFRSGDGLRSIRTSTADYDTPGLVSLSDEVRHRFSYDTPFLLEDASVVLFDNRLLITHSPFIYLNRALYQGLVVVNFDTLNSLGQKAAPIYEGEWDGIIISDIAVGEVNGVERCFILGRDETGSNCIYELLREADEPPVSADSPTQVFESRLFVAGDTTAEKILRRTDMLFSDIKGDLDVSIFLRPVGYPYWVRWDHFTAKAVMTSPSWGSPAPQSRGWFTTREAPDFIDPQTARPVNMSTGFQLRVEWRGRGRLDCVRVLLEPYSVAGYASNLELEPAGPLLPSEHDYAPGFWYRHTLSPLAGIEEDEAPL